MHSSVIPQGKHLDGEVGIEFGDPAGDDNGLVDADVAHRGRDAIQVRQLDGVRIGEAQAATQALLGQGVGDGVPDAEADDSDAQPAEAVLLGLGDLVAVAVQSELTEGERRWHRDERAPPREPRPRGTGGPVGVAERRSYRTQLGPEGVAAVEHGDAGAAA